MKVEFRSLKSRIAKRLFVLFLFVVLIPIALTTLLSYQQINKLVHQEQSTQLRSTSKGYGLEIFNRLYNAQEYLKIALSDASNNIPMTDEKLRVLQNHFSSITLYKKSSVQQSIFGNHQDKQWLAIKNSSSDDKILIMGKNSHADIALTDTIIHDGTSYIAIGVLNSLYVWADTELSAYEDLCITSTTHGLLHCSAQIPHSVLNKLENRNRIDLLDWESDAGEVYSSASWRLFLGYQFATNDWIIITSKPKSVIYESLVNFNNVLIPGVILALLLTIYATLIMIKRHLTPVETLIAGTKAISENQLGHYVTIETNDEYEDLAHSFNNMTHKLQDEFSINKVLSSIDQQLILRSGLNGCIQTIIENLDQLIDAKLAFMLVYDQYSQQEPALFRYNFSEKKMHIIRATLEETLLKFNDIEPDTSACFTYTQLQERFRNPYLSSALRYSYYPLHIDSSLKVALLIGHGEGELHYRMSEYLTHAGIVLHALNRETALEYQANTDRLTQLPNRNFFQRRMNNALKSVRNRDVNAALLFIDLDRFKNINDTLGHRAGDQLLQVASNRLLNMMPPNAFCARFGGDEFTIFVSDAQESELAKLSLALINALSENYYLDGYNANVSASIGISLCPRDGSTFDELLQCADLAMYKAKDRGRECFDFYDITLRNTVEERTRLEAYLRQVLKNDQLMVYYQPKVNIQSKKLSGFEALSRFRHPDKGFISPEKLYAIAEETGHVLELGYYVLKTALKQQVAWHDMGIWSGRMAVNVSPIQLFDIHFLRILDQALEESGANPMHLELEITEGVFIDNPELARTLFDDIRGRGITIAIDDFGTGYSSLAYITKLPVDNLKIDRAFVMQIDQGSKFRGVLSSMIQMAKHLGLQVTAEGIESQNHLEYLLSTQCDYIQGYLYSKPLSTDNAEQLLRTPSLDTLFEKS